MSSQSATFKQDVPPEGGYRKLDFSRLPAKKIWNWWSIIPAYIGVTSFGFYMWYHRKKELALKELENNTAMIAIMPLIIAEKDRLLLKNIRKVRDEERELMKNNPDWQTGTLYGDPIYKTTKDDQFLMPGLVEYYAHALPGSEATRYFYTWKY